MSPATRWLRSSARLRAIAFVARCTGSAMIASVLAGAIGLGHPIWAVVSSLVVSQDSARDTRSSFLWRVAATAIGLVVAVLIGALIKDPYPGRPIQLAGAITICASIARCWPALRVCMWTAPIVLMTTLPDRGVTHSAIERGSEVLLGAAIAVALHWILDRTLAGPGAPGGKVARSFHDMRS